MRGKNSLNASTPKISFIIPCYKSSASLHAVVREITDQHPSCDVEIVLVCDGSPDNTWERIIKLCQDFPAVRGILLNKNVGQHNAILCGIINAKGQILVTLDDDGQHTYKAVQQMLNELKDEVDLVYGIPLQEKQTFYRNMTSQIGKLVIQSLCKSNKTSPLRAFRQDLVPVFKAHKSHTCSIDVLLSWSTSRIALVTVPFQKRTHGESNYTTRQLVKLAISMITGYSVWPLKFASFVGFACTVFGLSLFLFVIVRYLIGDVPVQGFTFIAATVSLFSGLQMFCLGIIGEYLSRMYYRTLDRPPFIVKSTIPEMEDNE